MSNDWACWKCKEEKGIQTEKANLPGGVHARLCMKCCTDIDGILMRSEVVQKGKETVLRMKALLSVSEGNGRDVTPELLSLQRELHDCDQKVRQISLAWLGIQEEAVKE